jgi:hypothetical protein
MFAYFYVLNDYGFKFTTVAFLNNEPGYTPNGTDVYDPQAPNYGNTGIWAAGGSSTVDWGELDTNNFDLRLFFVYM